MKKTFKTIVRVILWLIALVAVALLTLPLWVGPVARTAANKIVPKYTGTYFNLGAFGLNYYAGRLHVGNVQLDNPAGYKPSKALTLGNLDVDVDMSTVLSETIVIRDVLVKDVFISITSEDGTNNFAAIAAYATKDVEPNEEEEEEDEEAASAESERKVVIDRIRLEGVTVQYEMVPIPLPTITLTDIGRESNGIEFEDAWAAIWDAIQKSATTVGGGLINLGTSVITGGTNVIGAGVEGAAAAVDAATTVLGAGTTVLDAGTQSVKDATQGVNDALDAAGDAVDSAAKKIKDVGKSFKGLFGK